MFLGQFGASEGQFRAVEGSLGQFWSIRLKVLRGYDQNIVLQVVAVAPALRVTAAAAALGF